MMDPSHGYSPYQYGGQYIAEQSTLEKITAKVYQAKLKVSRTLKKPEDEHLVASDAELDAKLETYRHVQNSCADLQRIVSMYATGVYALAQAENELGRYLKQQGERDKTRAGKMMQATGKSLSCASQQRLALRVPLTRLGGEVETFASRAVLDCASKVAEMEAARTNYRGSLLWMKDVSQRLDPEAFNRLEKFRKVQAQVKRAKERFDRLKLDSMQKVDLLVASRCNMFSRVLVLYQQTIVQFSHKTARIMCAVADAFQGYQYFEFNMLRDLTDCTRKLARETSGRNDGDSDDDAEDVDNGEQTLKDVESKLSAIVSEADAGGQSEAVDSDVLQLPTLSGAFSFGVREREPQTRPAPQHPAPQRPAARGARVPVDDDFEDPTKLYEYIRRSIFQQPDAAGKKPLKNSKSLKMPSEAVRSGAEHKSRGLAVDATSQDLSDLKLSDTPRRRGPIRDDEEFVDADDFSAQATRGPNPDIALEKLDELFAKEYNENEDSEQFNEPLDLTGKGNDAAQKVHKDPESLLLETLDLNAAPSDSDNALLTDLFGPADSASSGPSAPLMASEFASMFESNKPKPLVAGANDNALLGDDDPWNAFAAALPSRQMGALLQSDAASSGLLGHSTTLQTQWLSRASADLAPSSNAAAAAAAASPQRTAASNVKAPAGAPPTQAQGAAKKEELAAWFNMFADLDPLANPDKIGRTPGQDAFNEA